MRTISKIHHWLGTFFCVLFLIWFLSGFVMMYQSFPYLSKDKRINMLSYAVDKELLSPKDIFKKDTIKEISSLRLNYILDRPVFHLITAQGKLVSRYADNGEKTGINQEQAIKIARQNTKTESRASVQALTELDQWIPRTKFLPHMPIFKVEFEDANNTLLYISSVTGEVLTINTFSERFWSWLGAIPHWIYFRDIRVHNTAWAQLINWLSALGFVMAVTGMITGLVRYKKKPKAKFKRFKNKWYNYHYYLGLFFGIFVCTWIFSGWMSMTPFSGTPSTQLTSEETLLWQTQQYTLDNFEDQNWNNYKQLLKNKPYKEAVFTLFQNTVYTQLLTDNKSSLYGISTNIPDIKEYSKVVESFSPTNKITTTEVLQEYDNYYYSRHNDKDLPVIRINTTNDIAYYINPNTARVVYKCGTKNRIQRWIYHGLHSLDFSFLAWRRPLWDIVLFILLLGGTCISFTGVGLGVKFVKRKNRRRKRKKGKK